MKFTEIASRLNGFTLGPFGAQWTPKPSDVEIARRTIRFLEDRRILYNECAHEEATHCVESVLEIRRVLTDEIKCLGDSSDLLGPLRVMRAACRKFLDRMQYDRGSRIQLHYGWEGDRFYSTLGDSGVPSGRKLTCSPFTTGSTWKTNSPKSCLWRTQPTKICLRRTTRTPAALFARTTRSHLA